jgi:hypothetical protein
MSDYVLETKITADDSGYQAALDRIESGLNDWGINLDKLYQKGDEFFKGFGIDIDQFASKLGTSGPMLTAIVGIVAIATQVANQVINALNACGQEFATDEIAAIKFNAAIQNSSVMGDDATKTLKDLAESMAKLTGTTIASQESQIGMLAATGRNEDQIKKLITTAQGMANEGIMPMDSALRMLNMTYEGSAGRLTRYDEQIKGMTKDQLENGDAVNALNEKYGKYADLLGGSSQTSIGNYKNSINELNAIIGEFWESIVKQLRDTVTSIIEYLVSHKEIVIGALQGIALAVAGILTAISPIAGGIALAIELGAKLLSIFSQNKTTGKDAGDAIKSSFDGANAAVTATLNNADKTFATLIAGFEALKKTLGDLDTKIEQIKKDEQEWDAKTADQALKSVEDQKKAALDLAQSKNMSAQDIFNIAVVYDEKLKQQYSASIDAQEKEALAKAKDAGDSDKTIADIDLYYYNLRLTYATNLTNTEIALRDKIATKEKDDADKTLTEQEKLAKSIYDSFVSADVKKNKLDAAAAELQQKQGLTVQDAWLNVYANIQQAGESWNNTVQTISDSVSNTLSGGLKAMGAALIDGKASWKDYGKSALQALADVLDALGKQLSAMAAIAFGTGNFIGGAYDVSGAAAAFVSEGVITALAAKYATGTNYSVGGYALVGEYGPEIVKLPQGSQVNNSINNNQNSKQVTMYNSFNSPKALSEAEIGRQMRSMSRRMAFMGTI